MKKILLSIIVVIGLSASISAQCIPVPCTYSTSLIPFSLSPVGTNSVAQCDDCLSPAVQIGFPFGFMCSSYSTAIIGSNGFVALNPNQTGSGCCSGGIIPANDGVNGMIALFWTDLYNSASNSITYHTIGVAPNRMFVVTYSAVPVCCSTNFPHTGQVKLFETTGVIELHIVDLPNSGNTTTQGIENVGGTTGYTTAVMASSGYSAANVAYRYTPITTNSLVMIPSFPSAIAGPTSVCNGQASTFSVVAGSGATAYNWSLPAGFTGTSTNNIISPTITASGTLSLSITYSCGTISSPGNSVMVNSVPSVSVNSGTICSGNSFTMSPTGTANTYSFSSGSAVVSPSSSASYTVTGTNTITSCFNTAVSSVSVNPAPTVSVNSGAICSGGSFTMSPTGTANTYSFSSGTPVVTPSTSSSYTVTGTNTTTSCFNTAVSSVTVNALPTVTASSSSSILCVGQTATLTASGASSYSWLPTGTGTSIAVSPTVTSTYTVTGTDVNSCSSSTTITQSVSPCTGLSGNQALSIDVKLFPNPSSGLINLELNTASQVSITNTLGQVVLNQKVEGGIHTFNLQNQSKGIYFVKISQNNKHETIKIVIE